MQTLQSLFSWVHDVSLLEHNAQQMNLSEDQQVPFHMQMSNVLKFS